MRRTFLILAVVVFAISLFWAVRDPAQAISLVGAKLVPVAGEEGVYLGVLSIENSGRADVLLSAASDVAAVEIVGRVDDLALVVPMGAALLASDGAHLRISEVSVGQAVGTPVPLVLTFQQAGEVRTRALISEPEMMRHHAGHRVEATAGTTLALKLREEGGVSLEIETTGITFLRTSDDAAHVPGEGHAHLYLNGLKLGRVYGTEVKIGALPAGRYAARVSLNAHDHRQYAVGGVPLQDTLVFGVP